MNDEHLRAFRAGDKKAWRKVLSEHGPALLGYATRMLGGAARRSVAQDVVQDSLVSALKSARRFEGKSSVKAWLFRIVHNRAIDELRRDRRFVPLDHGDSDEADDGLHFNRRGRWQDPPEWHLDLADQVDAKRLLAVVRDQMDAMPHMYRQVLLLKEVYGMETVELCEALELTPSNARVLLHRARKALRSEVTKATRDATPSAAVDSCDADQFRAAMVGSHGRKAL